jgi:hypothetical protein
MDQITRRAALGSAGLCAVAVAAPVARAALPAATNTPFRLAEAEYQAATARFNELPSDLEASDPCAFEEEERAYLAVVNRVDAAPVESWAEFADAFEIACDRGYSLPNEELVFKLLADVRRLSGRAA